ncbi:MAG: DUF4282 domain-containing protein [Oscillospiraceae bacterium]|nr:DUF4282 domain-containing protein [Oscillospiraceae bacterium]
MTKKSKIKDFLNFKSLITESILKYVFWVTLALMIIGAIGWILVSLGSAVALIGNGYGFRGLLMLVGMPILILIGLVLSVIFLRIGFEAILVRFLIYREVKQINEK